MAMLPATAGPNDSIVVRPTGRLNMSVAATLRQELIDHIEGGASRIVVDLADVATVDSAVIGALISGLKAARTAGGDLRIVAPSRQVAEVLAMTNLTKVLAAYPSVESAFED